MTQQGNGFYTHRSARCAGVKPSVLPLFCPALFLSFFALDCSRLSPRAILFLSFLSGVGVEKVLARSSVCVEKKTPSRDRSSHAHAVPDT